MEFKMKTIVTMLFPKEEVFEKTLTGLSTKELFSRVEGIVSDAFPGENFMGTVHAHITLGDLSFGEVMKNVSVKNGCVQMS